jgi:hypothetical protein
MERMRDQQFRDERLYFAAAGHYALAADEHNAFAVSHERNGDREAAARERRMAQAACEQARGTAQCAVDAPRSHVVTALRGPYRRRGGRGEASDEPARPPPHNR